jgi:hypothetical protein
MKKLMTPSQKKVGKVMREFKRGELHSGKKGPVVKNPKQAIAIALSEAGKSRKPMAMGGSVTSNGSSSSRSAYGTQVDFSQFTNSDGTLKGGIDVEMTNPQETQVDQVGGQRRMLADKKRKAKWY